eukprot:m.45131 g.45131  ORF g.45131 m.45131 type:complete len:75 (-) comp6229_c0_seq1:2103-2327(-)
MIFVFLQLQFFAVVLLLAAVRTRPLQPSLLNPHSPICPTALCSLVFWVSSPSFCSLEKNNPSSAAVLRINPVAL